jgi:hypothetical protein
LSLRFINNAHESDLVKLGLCTFYKSWIIYLGKLKLKYAFRKIVRPDRSIFEKQVIFESLREKFENSSSTEDNIYEIVEEDQDSKNDIFTLRETYSPAINEV